MKKKLLIQEGKIQALYEDNLSHALLKKLGGEASIRRASHVEAVPGQRKTIEFQVDLSPSNGPTLAGFQTYQEAVKAEIDWLHKHTLVCT